MSGLFALDWHIVGIAALALLGFAGLALSTYADRPRRWKLNLAILIDGVLIEGKHMEITVPPVAPGAALHFVIKPTDDAGNPGTVTGIVWAADFGSLTPAADGLSAAFAAPASGSAKVTVTAVSAAGVTLSDDAVLTVTVPVVEVTKLNLAVA